MKRIFFSLSILLIAVLVLSGIPGKQQFYKGNLHAHSYWSDGNTFPDVVAEWFKRHGYDFLAVTDHNILQEGEKWIHVDRKEDIRANYDHYLEEFGESRLETETREGELYARLLTLEEYRGRFEEDGKFLLIHGEEISDASERKPVHLNGIHTTQVIEPTKGETVHECLRMNVERIRQSLATDGNPEWVIVNHPNFGWALTAKDMAMCGARFFEVYNGHPLVRNYGDEEHPGTEELWDEANRIRSANNEPLLLGIATDDSHDYIQFGLGQANPGRGWTMVRAEELTPAALYRAMINGDFYASTGVELKDFHVTNRAIQIRIQAERGVTYKTSFLALLEGESAVRLMEEQEGSRAKYTFTGKEVFVRAQIVSDKIQENPYQEDDVEKAWLQPVKP